MHLGLICLGVIVKTDVSWVPVSSCSYTPGNSPLTFKLTVKSIICLLSSINYLLTFKMLETSLSSGTFTIAYIILQYFLFSKWFHFIIQPAPSYLFFPSFLHFPNIISLQPLHWNWILQGLQSPLYL